MSNSVFSSLLKLSEYGCGLLVTGAHDRLTTIIYTTVRYSLRQFTRTRQRSSVEQLQPPPHTYPAGTELLAGIEPAGTIPLDTKPVRYRLHQYPLEQQHLNAERPAHNVRGVPL